MTFGDNIETLIMLGFIAINLTLNVGIIFIIRMLREILDILRKEE